MHHDGRSVPTTRPDRPGPNRRSVLAALGATGLAAAAAPLAAPGRPGRRAPRSTWTGRIPRAARARRRPCRSWSTRSCAAARPSTTPCSANCAHLHADHVRFVPWYPVPAARAWPSSKPPADGRTSWDFSLIDPLVEDFEAATRGHSTIMNFSTIPEWMWQAAVDGRRRPAHVAGGGNGRAASGMDWTDYTFAVDVTPLATAHARRRALRAGRRAVPMRPAATATASCCRTTPTARPRRRGYIVFVPSSAGRPAGTSGPPPCRSRSTPAHTYHLRDRRCAAATFDASPWTAPTSTRCTTRRSRRAPSDSASSAASRPQFDNVRRHRARRRHPARRRLLRRPGRKWAAPGRLPGRPGHRRLRLLAGHRARRAGPDGRRLLPPAGRPGTPPAGSPTSTAPSTARAHHYPFPYWEVLNDDSSTASARRTTRCSTTRSSPRSARSRRDEVRRAWRSATPGSSTTSPYFLDPANHRPRRSAGLDQLPLLRPRRRRRTQRTHTAAPASRGPTRSSRVVDQIEAVRTRSRRTVRTTVDETGTHPRHGGHPARSRADPGRVLELLRPRSTPTCTPSWRSRASTSSTRASSWATRASTRR